MREWITIAITGTVGGVGASLFTLELSPDWPDIDKGPVKRSIRWTVELFLNALGGAAASFILWATYTSSLTFDSTAFSPAEVGAEAEYGSRALASAAPQREAYEDPRRLLSFPRPSPPYKGGHYGL